jgi:hypothetical protein
VLPDCGAEAGADVGSAAAFAAGAPAAGPFTGAEDGGKGLSVGVCPTANEFTKATTTATANRDGKIPLKLKSLRIIAQNRRFGLILKLISPPRRKEKTTQNLFLRSLRLGGEFLCLFAPPSCPFVNKAPFCVPWVFCG